MRLPSAGSVGHDGQYRLDVALDAPPGRQSMQPELSIHYASSQSNGYLGVGWALGGLSQIGPCPTTFDISGKTAPVRLDGSDALCLDGDPLIDGNGNVATAAAPAGTRFGTLHDGRARISFVAVNTLGVVAPADGLANDAFKVELPNGAVRIYKAYGPTAGSSFWLLDRVYDPDGNSVHYTYRSDLAGAPTAVRGVQVATWEYPIDTIYYTEVVPFSSPGVISGAAITPGMRKVVFNYGGGRLRDNNIRPDIVSSRVGGAPGAGTSFAPATDMKSSVLLTSVDFYAPLPTASSFTSVTTGKAWSYSFGYDLSAATGRALLTSLYKSSPVAGGRTLAKVFGYQSTSQGFDFTSASSPWQVEQVGLPWQMPPKYQAYMPIDPAANGHTIMLLDDGTNILSVGTVGTSPVVVPGLAGLTLVGAGVADVNGDGAPELVAPDRSTAEYSIAKYNVATAAFEAHDAGWRGHGGGGLTGVDFVDLDGSGRLTALTDGYLPQQKGYGYFGSDPEPCAGSSLAWMNAGYIGSGSNLWLDPDISREWACRPTSTAFGFDVRPIDGNALVFTATGATAAVHLGCDPVQTKDVQASDGCASAQPTVARINGPLSAPAGWYLMPSLSHRGTALSDGAGATAFSFTGDTAGYQQSAGSSGYLPWVGIGNHNIPIWDVSAGGLTPAPGLSSIEYSTSLGNLVVTAMGPNRINGVWPTTYQDGDGNTAYHSGTGKGGLLTAVGNFDGASSMEVFTLNPAVHLPGLDQSLDNWTITAMDFTLDGRDDVIAYHWPGSAGCSLQSYKTQCQTPAWDAAYLLTWHADRTLSTPTYLGMIPVSMSDVTGDGIPDLFAGQATDLAAGIVRVFPATSSTQDLLTSVTDQSSTGSATSLPALEQITYDAHWYGSTGGAPPPVQPGCVWPLRCIYTGMNVVAQITRDQGPDVGNSVTAYYTYANPVASATGGGFLGFGEVEIWEPERKIETVIQYANTSRTSSGRVLQTTTSVPIAGTSDSGATALRQTTVTDQYTTTHPNADSITTFTVQSGWTSTEAEGSAKVRSSGTPWIPPPSLALTQYPTAHFAVTSPTTLRYKSGSFQFDGYGNRTSETYKTSSDPWTVNGTQTVRTMTPAPALTGDQWIVNRPATLAEQTWMPATDAMPPARTTDYVYDPLHPALIEEIILNQALSVSTGDATGAVATVIQRSNRGVPTSWTHYAVDPEPATGVVTVPCPWGTGSSCITRSSQVTLEANEGIFPQTMTEGPLSTQLLVYPQFGVVAMTIDSNNITTKVGLDDLGRLVSVQHDGGDGLTRTYAQRLDPIGQILGSIVTDATMTKGTHVTYTDVLGRPVARASLAMTGNWDCTSTNYDNLGRAVFQHSPIEGTAADCTPGSTALSDFVGTITAFDPLDRPTNVREADGGNTRIQYSFSSATTTDPMQHQSVKTLDINDRLLKSTQVLVSSSGTQNVTTSYTYEPFNLLHSVTDNAGNVTTYTHDSFGREIGEMDPDRGSTSYAYNGFGELVSSVKYGAPNTRYNGFAYALGGLSVTNGSSGATLSVSVSNAIATPLAVEILDEADHVVQVCATGTVCSAILASSTVAHTYRAVLLNAGKEVAAAPNSVTVPGSGGSTAVVIATRETRIARDSLGRITSVQNGEDGTSSWTYDTSAHGKGLVASATSNDGTSRAYGYDAYARQSSTIDSITLPGSTTPLTFGFKYNYTVYGAPSGVTSSKTGLTVGYGFNTNDGRLDIVTFGTSTNATLWTADSRMPDGQLKGTHFGNGITETRGYDPVGRLTSITDMGGNTTVRTLSATRDLEGFVKTQTTDSQRTETFTYDSLHHLGTWGLTQQVPAGLAGRTQSYTYDQAGIGNLTQVSGTVTNTNAVTSAMPLEWDYYEASQPHAFTGTNVNGVIGAYAYDDRGRQVSSPTRQSVQYNSTDRVTSITSSGNTFTYKYAPNGARALEFDTKSGNSTISVPSLYERRATASGTKGVYFVPGPLGVTIQISFDEANAADTGTVEYILQDRHGAPAVVTGAVASVQAHEYLDPFGARVDAYGTYGALGFGDVRTGIQGAEQSDALGIVDMVGRIYDPAARHFLSADPHTTDASNGQSFNRYSYALNNPVNFTDPTGYDWLGDYITHIVSFESGIGWYGNSPVVSAYGFAAGSIMNAPGNPFGTPESGAQPDPLANAISAGMSVALAGTVAVAPLAAVVAASAGGYAEAAGWFSSGMTWGGWHWNTDFKRWESVTVCVGLDCTPPDPGPKPTWNPELTTSSGSSRSDFNSEGQPVTGLVPSAGGFTPAPGYPQRCSPSSAGYDDEGQNPFRPGTGTPGFPYRPEHDAGQSLVNKLMIAVGFATPEIEVAELAFVDEVASVAGRTEIPVGVWRGTVKVGAPPPEVPVIDAPPPTAAQAAEIEAAAAARARAAQPFNPWNPEEYYTGPASSCSEGLLRRDMQMRITLARMNQDSCVFSPSTPW